MASALPHLQAGTLLASRYRLADDIRLGGRAHIWRGVDERLHRPVSLRLMRADDDRAAAVRAAALRAAGVNSRHLIPVIDLIDDGDVIGVVSDWTDWPTLGYLSRDPLPAQQALRLTLEVGTGLTRLAEAGLAHGRLHPNSVHVDSLGQVKLRGFQVDAAIHGLTDDQAVLRANDARALLGTLYLALTGFWPDGVGGAAEYLAVGGVPRPSQLVADIPNVLDQLLSRGFEDVAAGRLDTQGVIAAMAVARDSLSAGTPPSRSRSNGLVYLGRAAVVVVVGMAAAALTMAGISQASQEKSATDPEVALNTDDGVLAREQQQDVKLGPSEHSLAIEQLSTLDPDGDGTENPQLLTNIIDDDPGTAWTTKPYFTEDVGGKRGVGVVLDLGTDENVTSLDLQLIGTSTDFTVMLADSPDARFDDYRPVAEVSGAGQSVFVRLPKAGQARTVLIWFTTMSKVSTTTWSSNGYRAGIRGVKVYGTEGDGAS